MSPAYSCDYEAVLFFSLMASLYLQIPSLSLAHTYTRSQTHALAYSLHFYMHVHKKYIQISPRHKNKEKERKIIVGDVGMVVERDYHVICHRSPLIVSRYPQISADSSRPRPVAGIKSRNSSRRCSQHT